MKPNIETFIACDAPFEEANIVLFGAPFDSTTSFRPGARFGPSAMRHESFGLETYSPYQDKDLTDCKLRGPGAVLRQRPAGSGGHRGPGPGDSGP